MNLLVFSFFPAFVPPESGGEVRLFNFYFHLGAFHNIVLLSSGHIGVEVEAVRHSTTFLEQRIPKDTHFAEAWQVLKPDAGSGDLSGPCLAASSGKRTRLHEAYLAHYEWADAIIHDSPFTIGYDLMCHLDDKPRIYNSYNCEVDLYRQMHRDALTNVVSSVVETAEKAILEAADLVTYCLDRDLASFQSLFCRPVWHSLYVPNGMNAVHKMKREPRKVIRRVIFLGSGHLPNQHAAKFIIENIAPYCPALTFDVVGHCLPEGEYPSNVVRHGLVDAATKIALMSAADIAINPMLDGSGSSLKILDFVAHRVPLLSTPAGVRGFDFIDKQHCVVANADRFVAILNEFASDQHRCVKLSKLADAAYEFALTKYTWSAVAERFSLSLAALVKARQEKPRCYVLALNDYDPYTSVGGGATRFRGMYEAVAKATSVVLLCLSSNGELDVREVAPRVLRVRVPKMQTHLDAETASNSRFHISVNDILCLQHSVQNKLLVDLYGLLRRNASIVVCDHPYLSPLARLFSDRFVYSSQNHETTLKRELLKWHPDRDSLLPLVADWEEYCVIAAAAIVVVSEDDAIRMLAGARGAGPVHIVPNGAAIPPAPPISSVGMRAVSVGERSAVFVGSAHMPNVDSAKFIVDELAPNLPDIEFHLIGSVCDAVGDSSLPNVRCWGVLGDREKSAVMRSCRVAVNPIFSGGGSNIKLADYFAHGLHVVSTTFGTRGYPAEASQFITVAERETFCATLGCVLRDGMGAADQSENCKEFFLSRLSMVALASTFSNILVELSKPKRRMLFVTYRFSTPVRGGAEMHLARLIEAAAKSGHFEIDIVAPEVSVIEDVDRFGARYEFSSDCLPPLRVPNTRFVRFPRSNQPDTHQVDLKKAWLAQCAFEKQLYFIRHDKASAPICAWGWGYPEQTESGASRWMFTEAGLHLSKPCKVMVSGRAFVPTHLIVNDGQGNRLLDQLLDGDFSLAFDAEVGPAIFLSSIERPISALDIRPLALYISRIMLDSEHADLSKVAPAAPQNALEFFEDMHKASTASRGAMGISLANLRGPHSESLEAYVHENVPSYDLVVTHNSIFRPAQVAIAAAKEYGVPSILIPHAHLDDDFYHFPDVQQAALDADLVLACPKVAQQFFQQLGAKNVSYHSPGVDVQAQISQDDIDAFRVIYNLNKPFFLVLGRKAAVKGYKNALFAIEKVSKLHDVHLLLIGPDDDGEVIKSPHATYLGMQPSNIVRAALAACVAVVNMSASESFGMVLLESWRAQRPVIVNAGCVAFTDLVIDGMNGFAVHRDNLAKYMEVLLHSPELAHKMGLAGSEIVKEYAWPKVCDEFVAQCLKVCKS